MFPFTLPDDTGSVSQIDKKNWKGFTGALLFCQTIVWCRHGVWRSRQIVTQVGFSICHFPLSTLLCSCGSAIVASIVMATKYGSVSVIPSLAWWCTPFLWQPQAIRVAYKPSSTIHNPNAKTIVEGKEGVIELVKDDNDVAINLPVRCWWYNEEAHIST